MLQLADQGDLAPLVTVFAAAQKKAFVQALGISRQVLDLRRAEEVVRATRRQLEDALVTERERWEAAKTTARALADTCRERFSQLAETLRDEMRGLLAGSLFTVRHSTGGDGRAHYYRFQIIQTAQRLGYWANLREHRAWVSLVLRTGDQAEILVSFHGSGEEYRGILAASACFFRKEESEDGNRDIVDLVPLTDEIFQINYLEKTEDALVRFQEWQEQVLTRGLEVWRKGL